MMARKFPKTRSSIRLPIELSRCGAALLDQQMWCWGCDVRRAEGNLLVTYGATKRPSPDPRYHSAYSFCLREGAVLNLWGWGVWIAHEGYGSLFLSRARFRACYTADVHLLPDAWRACDLPHTGTARHAGEQQAAYRLLADAMAWMGDYETWLTTQVPSDYRERVIASWPERRRCHGGTAGRDMAATWKSFAELLRKEMHHGEQTQNHTEETDVWQQPSVFTQSDPA
jgi:hypothetical protein